MWRDRCLSRFYEMLNQLSEDGRRRVWESIPDIERAYRQGEPLRSAMRAYLSPHFDTEVYPMDFLSELGKVMYGVRWYFRAYPPA